MEYNTNKLADLNWNAGTEFNKIIGELKLKYLQAVLIRDFDSCLEILSMDLDFAFAKIYEESIKRNKDSKIKQTKQNIEKKIKECREFIKQKKVDERHNNFRGYEFDIKERLENIRQKIWGIQGEYGVLYPQLERKIRDKGKSLRDGFKT